MLQLGTDRVFWRGGHATLGWGSPIGKLHREGLRVLTEGLGFQEVARDFDCCPAFYWSTRRAADFPATGVGLPLIRQLPQANSGALDDKFRCACLLNAAAFTESGLAPATYVDLPALRDALRATPPEDAHEPLYFLKHRLGVKGQAVTPMRASAMLEWLTAQRRPSGEFVVQAEVPPALDGEGRKFVMRCHALVACRAGAMPAAWLHRDVIALAHASVYDLRANDKAVHVSQCGRRHPPPVLLEQLPPEHPAAAPELPARLKHLVARTLAAAAHELIPEPRCSRATLYSVLGLDVALESGSGQPQLLEVNSYPAVADGTMGQVPTAVYTRLVRDVVALLVHPALETGVEPREGGFEQLEDAFAQIARLPAVAPAPRVGVDAREESDSSAQVPAVEYKAPHVEIRRVSSD